MITTEAGRPEALTRDFDGSRFRRHSIFEEATAESVGLPGRPNLTEPDWLEGAREQVTDRGQFLAFSDAGEIQVAPLLEGWSRIGRSAAADVRLDDASVSRRHAMIVNSPETGLRILDDRSLNGICLNGERVDWGALEDGDELQIGRFRIFVIDSELAEAAS